MAQIQHCCGYGVDLSCSSNLTPSPELPYVEGMSVKRKKEKRKKKKNRKEIHLTPEEREIRSSFTWAYFLVLSLQPPPKSSSLMAIKWSIICRLVGHTVWSACLLLTPTDFFPALLISPESPHTSSLRKVPVATVKHHRIWDFTQLILT